MFALEKLTYKSYVIYDLVPRLNRLKNKERKIEYISRRQGNEVTARSHPIVRWITNVIKKTSEISLYVVSIFSKCFESTMYDLNILLYVIKGSSG
jgi:hypothetical protein